MQLMTTFFNGLKLIVKKKYSIEMLFTLQKL